MGEEGRMGNQDRDKTPLAPLEDLLGADRIATAVWLYSLCHTESYLPQHTPALTKAADNLRT